jgi:hypothetical protein
MGSLVIRFNDNFLLTCYDPYDAFFSPLLTFFFLMMSANWVFGSLVGSFPCMHDTHDVFYAFFRFFMG